MKAIFIFLLAYSSILWGQEQKLDIQTLPKLDSTKIYEFKPGKVKGLAPLDQFPRENDPNSIPVDRMKDNEKYLGTVIKPSDEQTMPIPNAAKRAPADKAKWKLEKLNPEKLKKLEGSPLIPKK